MREYKKLFFKGNKLAFFFALLSTALLSAVNLVTAWLMQQMLDSVSYADGMFTPFQLLFMILAVLLLIVIIKGMDYGSRPRYMKKAMEQYKNYAFEKLMINKGDFYSLYTSTQ